MAGIITYIEEVVDEMGNKVSWPTWTELQSSSIIVLIASFIIAGIVYAMDSTFSFIMKSIYNDLFN